MRTYIIKMAAVISLFCLNFSAVSKEPVSSSVFPFDKNRASLYDKDELLDGYDSDPKLNKSLDWKIFQYYVGGSKYAPTKDEILAQRRHDAGIDFAVNSYFKIDGTSAPLSNKVVVVMGSHSMYRDDPWYRKAAELGYLLHKAGYTVVSGGGPGIMEATHLGAWMSKYSPEDLDAAIAILASTSKPSSGSPLKQYEMLDYWQNSVKVTTRFPNGNESLGIPTWFYGHEGANAFSTHVAKYFSNALREEKLCAIGVSGLIFFPGGPGTAQEIFMDAAENGYASYNWYSPMVFYSDRPESAKAKDLVADLMRGKKFGDLGMIGVAQSSDEVIAFLNAHPPVPKNVQILDAINKTTESKQIKPQVEASPVD